MHQPQYCGTSIHILGLLAHTDWDVGVGVDAFVIYWICIAHVQRTRHLRTSGCQSIEGYSSI